MNYRRIVIALIGLAALVGLALFAFRISSPELPIDVPKQVVLKPNADNGRFTDVYLKDEVSGSEKFYTTLPDAYREHYHPAEFKNGSLFIIRRVGINPDGSLAPDWNDQLWKYKGSGSGKKLLEARGLDFRVSADASRIATIFTTDVEAFQQSLVLTDADGNVVKRLNNKDFKGMSAESLLSPLFWDKDALWLTSGMAMTVNGIYSLSFDGTITGYDIHGLSFSHNEFAISPATKKLVFDDYNTPVTVEDSKIVQNVTIYVYDLLSGEKTRLASLSTNNPPAPNWINDSTVEYADAYGKRIRIRVKTK